MDKASFLALVKPFLFCDIYISRDFYEDRHYNYQWVKFLNLSPYLPFTLRPLKL